MATRNKPAVVNAVQPAGKLEIDGKSYQLVYDYNHIAEAELATGGTCNLLHGLVMPSAISALQLRGLLYAALQSRHPYVPATRDREASGLSIADAGKLIRVDTIERILKALGESWALAMPVSKGNPLKAAGEKTDPPSGQ